MTLPVSDSPPASGHDGHAFAVGGVAGYGRVHRARIFAHAAVHHALVHAGQAVVGELR